MSGDRARDEATIRQAIRYAPEVVNVDGVWRTDLPPLRTSALAALARLSADRDTPPEPGQATSKDFGDSRFAADVGTAASLEEGLARVYRTAPATIACLCDKWLDKSGVLLGRVRTLAAEVSGGTPNEPEQATTDAGGHRSAVSSGTWTLSDFLAMWAAEHERIAPALEELQEAERDADRILATATRFDRVHVDVERYKDLLYAVRGLLEAMKSSDGTTETAERSFPDPDVEAQLIKEYAIQDELRESVGRLEEALRAAERERDEKVSRRIAVDALVDAYDREQKLTEERNEARLRAAVAQQERDEAVKRAYITDVVSRAEEDRQKWRVGRLEEALRAGRWLLEVAEDFLRSEYPQGPSELAADDEAARLARAVAGARAALVGVEPPPSEADLGAAGGGVAEDSDLSGDSDDVWLCPDCYKAHGREEPCPT